MGTGDYVTAEATIESLPDRWEAERGERRADQIRRVVVPDARVEEEMMLLSLPTRLIRRLGLARTGCKHFRRNAEPEEMYWPVRLTIQGRECTMDVLEVPDGVPVLIGQIPLEHLDFVIDPQSRTLIGNPRHGGEHVYEMY